MKITDITIENLGPYMGRNTFSFTIDEPGKKVVLVGGKNGAGKTSLFNAIRVGLYGCRAYGYESDNAKYLETVYELINETAKLSRTGKAGVTISILMDDGKDDFIYTFQRSWTLNTKSKHEDVVVKRGGDPLDETETSDFQSYLLQLIPPDMFKFYFFDGESISNFVFNGIKNTDFKNAFLKLCGLDTMEIIYENFLRVSNMRKKDSSGTVEEYQKAIEEQKACEEAYAYALDQKDLLEQKLVEADENLAKAEENFIHRGGITREEYQSMVSQLSREENVRENARKWLKEAANDRLPFVFLKDQLLSLREQVIKEEQAAAADALIDCLGSADVKKKLEDAFAAEKVASPGILTEKVIGVLSSSVAKSEGENILNLSKNEQMDLMAKIGTMLSFDTARVYEESKIIDDSLERVKQIRSKLDKSDESNADSYFEQKDQILNEKNRLLQKLLETERDIDRCRQNKAEADSRQKKCQHDYEAFLKARSVNDVTAKALLAFTELQKRLYKKYVSDVEENFKACFSNLINKNDLIDGIKIDDQLQVYPYKQQTFLTAELDEMIAKNGDNYMISQLGSIAYEAYMEADRTKLEISIPVEVKKKLSAGERQIFIMSLYQALSTLNKVSVPYIIDTPFARIDTEHRQNILRNFFMNLKGQMIILSTDEEIVGEYRKSIAPAVSDYYLLRHTENNGSEILPGTYFEEV